MTENLRSLPAIDQLLERPRIREAQSQFPRALVVKAARTAVAAARTALRNQTQSNTQTITPEWIEDLVLAELTRMLSPSLRSVINATGVILHTNLGRAPIGMDILHHAVSICGGYSNLEYDLGGRQRGSRHQHVEELLRALLGVDAAIVVNNCAAAVLLMVSALARGRQVVVSRGELVEIGGSFRIPEVMEQSGALLREVGTTNRTRLADYGAAIGEQTALLMKAYRSNFAIVGFTEEVARADLVQLAHKHGIFAVEDLGSGLLVDLKPFGIKGATTVGEVVAEGLDVVCFSGDKLLGGPQAGIIVGTEPLVRKMRSHPLMRALRTDKWTIASLEATLISYLDGTWTAKIPTFTLLAETPEQILTKAQTVAAKIRGDAEHLATVDVRDSVARVGGGTLPLSELQSYSVTITPRHISGSTVDELLRNGPLPVVARIEDEKVCLDVRSVFAHQTTELAEMVICALKAAPYTRT